MEATAFDVSPAPSTRSFKAATSKETRGTKDTFSIPSTNGTDYSSETNGMRSSMESSQENVQTSRQSSADGITTTKTRKLSKLIPGRLKKKKKTDQQEEGEGDTESDGRGRSIGQTATTSTPFKPSINSRSHNTLDRADEGYEGQAGGNLIAYDTGNEEPPDSPPRSQNHPSRASYLTSSIKAVDPPSSPLTNNISTRQYSVTNPNNKGSEVIDLAPRNAAAINLQQSEQSLGVPEAVLSKNRRGISPGAKFRNVFTSNSRKMDASPPASPDSASVKSPGGGNTLGGVLTTGEKRNSVNLQKEMRLPKGPPSIPQSPSMRIKSPNSSDRNLPSLAVTPRTPPSAALDAPLTTVTPPTPTDQQLGSSRVRSPKSPPASSAGTNENIVVSASGNMISHRRVRSDSATHQPSKLSNTAAPPLTPTVEEPTTSNNRTMFPQSGTGGFLSSVFSLAQNATNTLTNSLANTNSSRPRSSTLTIDEDSNREVETSSSITGESGEAPVEPKRKLAIDTLGTGDLSLSHLGIAPDTPMTTNSVTGAFPTVADELSQRSKVAVSLRRDDAATRAEDISAARGVPAVYGDKTANEKHLVAVADDAVPAISGEKTPPNGSVFEGDQGARRSGSVRSRVGAVTRRHRNSSSTTGNTVGTGGTFSGVSQTNLGNHIASASTPKLTGFAVASKKRNRDFHQLFRSIPEDDYLIEDYSCALQREIILAGRIFDEIVSVEKESTAVVFPNAIAIQTLHARQTFRSLLSREATYELIIGIWKLSHPSLKSSLNGVRLDVDDTGDKTEKIENIGSEPSDASEGEGEEEEVYDEDENEGEDEGLGSFTEAGDHSVVGSEDNDSSYRTVTRKASAMGVAIGAAAGGVPISIDGKAGEKAAILANVDFPGPPTHAPTECSDGDTHYDKVVKDDIIPAPLGKVYSMMFGPASGGFMTRWFLDEQKMMDLQMEDDKKGLSEDNRTRSYSYIKPLYASIGPKQTKCLITETLDSIDLEKAVSVTVVTQTPDVPSGSVFSTKTKFCLTWAPGNSTRLFVNCMIEWTGKSWLKGPIEKGANDGQATYATDLVKALKAGVMLRPRTGTNSSRTRVKSKRRKGDIETPKKSIPKNPKTEAQTQQSRNGWGISSLVNTNIIIGILTFLLFITWLRIPSKPSRGGVAFPQMSTPERVAAYEEIWRREESSVWDWLEERIRMEGIAYPSSVPSSDQEAVKWARRQREHSLKHRVIKKELPEKMSQQEIDDAIRVTEERLEVLKNAMSRKRDRGTK